ncbi:amino acid adenylation domain-containing protein [Streptomyces griseoruber]|uniref:amino acid adenylation domain-containing protein n=1 Tax=Streptomyces griseoruber TaxID=1943 RepID=UPI0006E3CABF|nr:amino acid adenylation domain-containing protein [Streptomyces griseoruber]
MQTAPTTADVTAPRRPTPSGGLLHEHIAAQAARRPDAVAVVESGSGAALSYAQLDSQANQLAHHLRHLGVGPGTMVGVLLRRSLELPLAVLAVAKSGAAFVPLDVAVSPPDRVAGLLEDAGCPVLITDTSLADTLSRAGRPENRGRKVVRLDAEAGQIARWPSVPPDCPATEDDLAYVIHTSGSTGRPKGVHVQHRSLVNYLLWCRDTYLVPGAGGAPLFTSVAFDLALTGLLVPLLGGQRVVLAPDDADVAEIADLLRQYRGFSFVKATPTYFELLGALLGADAPDVARHLVVGGERLSLTAVERWYAGAEPPVVFNEYGPTEGTVANVVHRVDPVRDAGRPVPIGRPIPGTRAYVLDGSRHPVSPGTVGELYLGGVCLARGYGARPGLTALRFVPDPRAPGERMYRTGDLARVDDDGELVCLGRADHQIALRGYRIEPEEIEAVLAEQDGVAGCAVSLRIRERSGPCLVAFAVPSSEQPPSVPCLRSALARRLPPYMLPSEIRWIDELPLTANGKLDRAALPD